MVKARQINTKSPIWLYFYPFKIYNYTYTKISKRALPIEK